MSISGVSSSAASALAQQLLQQGQASPIGQAGTAAPTGKSHHHHHGGGTAPTTTASASPPAAATGGGATGVDTLA